MALKLSYILQIIPIRLVLRHANWREAYINQNPVKNDGKAGRIFRAMVPSVYQDEK